MMSHRPVFFILGLMSTTVFGQIRVVSLPPPGAGTEGAFQPFSHPDPAPYYQRPGVYVLPSPGSTYRATPLPRPWPDYSTLRDRHPRRFEIRHYFPRSPCGDPPSWGAYGGSVEDLRDAYNQGRYDADREYLADMAAQRAGRLLNQYSIQFDEGLRLFREGHYEHALMNLLGAADKNHDSAAPRLHAGHALFALGRSQQAVALLERAFELAPSLATRTYFIRDEYGHPEVFESHRARLADYARRNPTDAAAWTLHGYVTYYTDGPSAAEPILRHASRLNPRNTMIAKLRAVSSLSGDPADPPVSNATTARLVLKSSGRDTIPAWKTSSPATRKTTAKSSSR